MLSMITSYTNLKPAMAMYLILEEKNKNENENHNHHHHHHHHHIITTITIKMILSNSTPSSAALVLQRNPIWCPGNQVFRIWCSDHMWCAVMYWSYVLTTSDALITCDVLITSTDHNYVYMYWSHAPHVVEATAFTIKCTTCDVQITIKWEYSQESITFCNSSGWIWCIKMQHCNALHGRKNWMHGSEALLLQYISISTSRASAAASVGWQIKALGGAVQCSASQSAIATQQHTLTHMASPLLLFHIATIIFCTLVFDHTAMLWNWLRNNTLPAILYIPSCPTLLCETVVTLQNKVECNLTERHCTCAQCTVHGVHISAMKRSICPWAVV